MPKIDWRGQVVLVTGASSGIGRAFALLLAERGAELVLLARSQEKLEQLASEVVAKGAAGAHVIVADLAEPGAVSGALEQLKQRQLSVAHLINNAGLGNAMAVAKADVPTLLRMIHLNCGALTELTARLLPAMIERRGGGVLQVASMVAFYPSPYMAVYAATKAYVLSLSEALSVELSGSGVRVSALCPGQVPTGFQATAGFGKDEVAVPGTLSAQRTAALALSGYERNKTVFVPGFLNRLSAWFMVQLPRRWVAKIAAGVLAKMGRFD